MSGASLKDGSATSVYLAESEEVENVSGKYFINSAIASCSNPAGDSRLQEKLWKVSETIVKNYLLEQ